MDHYTQVDLKNIKTISLKTRKSKMTDRNFAQVYDPRTASFDRFIKSLPHILVADDLRSFVMDIRTAKRRNKPVILMMGAHMVKVGLSPLIIDLMKRRIITALAMNSAAAIHDVEIVLSGKTSEDVEANIVDGTFGMSRETGEFINGVLETFVAQGMIGYGQALGKALQKMPRHNLSLLATCSALKIPVTVHAAIGTDIIHQQPTMNGAVTGEMTFRDFKVLCNVLRNLGNGGVVMNFGSAVLMPEVFLKALTVARNLGPSVRKFITANFDMIQHYRPRMNVVQRPTQNGGKGYMFTGHHEIMFPLLCAMIKNELRSR